MDDDRQLELDDLPHPTVKDWGEVLERYRGSPVVWDLLGEGSQDTGSDEPA